jgi:tRNA(fMet)-specific endonuclease VapC
MILDTNALSAWADGATTIRPALSSAARLVVPAVVLGEYLFGILQSRHRQRYEKWLLSNLPATDLATIGQATVREYAGIRLELKKQATPIPTNDAWIAALARQHSLPILSNDTHFDAVSGIQRIAFWSAQTSRFAKRSSLVRMARKIEVRPGAIFLGGNNIDKSRVFWYASKPAECDFGNSKPPIKHPMNKFQVTYRSIIRLRPPVAALVLAAASFLAGSTRAYAASTLFFDNFSGPTLSSAWQASLPTMNQENAFFGPQPATYVGAPLCSFQTLGGSSVIRMTETNSALTRRGWSTTASFSAASFHYEVRFNTLVQSAATSIDSFIEIGLLDPANAGRYDLVAPFEGGSATDPQFVTGSSIDNSYAAVSLTYQNNTWYRVVLDASAGGNVRASVQYDAGIELMGRTFSHGAGAFSSGYELILSQAMGEPNSPQPQDVAVDYASLTTVPEPGSASLACCGLVLWAVRRRIIRRLS